MEINVWLIPKIIAVAAITIFGSASAEEMQMEEGDMLLITPVFAGPGGDHVISVEWSWPEEFLEGPESPPYTTEGPLELEALASTKGELIGVTVESYEVTRDGEAVEITNVVNPNTVRIIPASGELIIEFEITGVATLNW